MARTMKANAIEYLVVEIKADVDLLLQPVAFSFDRGVTWGTAEWSPTPSHRDGTNYVRQARLLLGDTAPMPDAGDYAVWVRVTDVPEVLELTAGALVVEGIGG